LKQFVNFIERQNNRQDEIQKGTIVELVEQVKGKDYYDININGQLYARVPCAVPDWLESTLEQEEVASLIVSGSRIMTFQRTAVFKPDDSVQVIFPGGRKSPIISLEGSGVKDIPAKIIYV